MKLKTVTEGICFDPRDNLPQFKDFHLREDPLYFVDLVTPAYQFTTFANCYAIDKASLKHYKKSKHTPEDAAKLMKRHRYVLKEYEPFARPQTLLAKAANKLYQRKPEKYFQDKTDHAIFTSIVCKGTDTFSHKQCRGFNERTPSRISVMGKHNHLIAGDRTHVFISLSNILLLRTFSPKKAVLNQLKEQVNSLITLL